MRKEEGRKCVNHLGLWFVFYLPLFLPLSPLINFPCVTTFPELQPDRKGGAGATIVSVMKELWIQTPAVSSS